jgi:hypothetical protein
LPCRPLGPDVGNTAVRLITASFIKDFAALSQFLEVFINSLTVSANAFLSNAADFVAALRINWRPFLLRFLAFPANRSNWRTLVVLPIYTPLGHAIPDFLERHLEILKGQLR